MLLDELERRLARAFEFADALLSSNDLSEREQLLSFGDHV
jgi:hypothetical protein